MSHETKEIITKIIYGLAFGAIVVAASLSFLAKNWSLFIWQVIALGYFFNSIFYMRLYQSMRDLYGEAMKVWEEHIKSVSTIMESVDEQELKNK